MNIQIVKVNDVFQVAILGNISKKSEIEKFISEMDNLKDNKIILTFFDAKVLPDLVINKLIEVNDKNKFKIQVTHNFLSSYFFRLGIDHILLTNKSQKLLTNKKIKALAIGGSAGSLERIIAIIKTINKKDFSIFIVQHILENAKNYLPSILAPYTDFVVKEGVHDEIIKTGHIYIAPAGFQMKVSKGRIVLTDEPPAYFARPSIDVLFNSLSLEYKSNLTVILLSGYNDDGSHSLELLRKNNSTVLIQDPEECLQKELLLNAIKTGFYNYIFPLPELIHYLNRHINPQDLIIDDRNLKDFLEKILEKYGYDYRGYHYESLNRLIIKEMAEQGIDSFDQFKDLVLNYSEAFEALFLEFSINVTEFFRNPKVFDKIRNNVFAYLSSFPHIKIWCAGCSTGEEPYSLAIILKEAGLLEKSQIYATDINPFIIEQAKNGFYSKDNISKNISNYLESGGKGKLTDYFDDYKGVLKVKSEIKEKILFFQHSLVNQGVLNEFNLILCRNVLIYFDNNFQEKTINLFNNSLSNNGFLILGESEYIKNTNLFSLYDKNLKILKKSY